MTMQIYHDRCLCGGNLITDTLTGEKICSACGVVIESRLIEENPVFSDQNSTVSQKYIIPGTHVENLSKDHSGAFIRNDIKASILRAQSLVRVERTKDEKKRAKMAVKKAMSVYHKSLVGYYDERQLRKDEEEIVDRILNLVNQLGKILEDDIVFTSMKNYIKEKIDKNHSFAQHFELETLDISIRWSRNSPSNITARGNQLGKKRLGGYKERPIRCNLCNIDFGPRNRCRGHQMRIHPDIPYNLYTKRKNNYVSRSLQTIDPDDVIVDCSAASEKKKELEYGRCTNCKVERAIISRYEINTKKGKKRRLTARHKDQLTGKWKVCIIKERKSN